MYALFRLTPLERVVPPAGCLTACDGAWPSPRRSFGTPELVLLDEPTSGLDPHLVVLVRDVLRAERSRGCSMLVSSHVLTDLQSVCDHVVFIEAGRVIDQGPLAAVTGRTRRVYLCSMPSRCGATRATVARSEHSARRNRSRGRRN